MGISNEIIERLLYEEESSILDFKRDQYPFSGASDDHKSELLKDILAFTNAWRRTDAYILIGVEEVRGGRCIVHGISQHFDDAHLQEFVNSKTQRPVHFSYQAAEFEGKQIGIINIPPQNRPIYIQRNYGRLVKNIVYLRRGSSTSEANPDEIAKMGEYSNNTQIIQPLLEIEFAETAAKSLLGNMLKIQTTNIRMPDPRYSPIPDYGQSLSISPFLSMNINNVGINKNYYREIANYYRTTMSVKSVNFLVTNYGTVVADDVRIEIRIEDNENKYIFIDENDYPEKPETDTMMNLIRNTHLNRKKPDVEVQKCTQFWMIYIVLGKIQPKGTAWTTSNLYIGAVESCVIDLPINIFADNIPDPKKMILKIKVEAEEKYLNKIEDIDL